MSGEKAVKKLAVRVMVFYQLAAIAMQFYKPAGTGAEGSPATGPIPVMVALLIPSLIGMGMM